MFTLDQRMDYDSSVSGTEGIVFILFPDGRRKILANVIKFEAKLKYTKKQIPILGRKTKANKKGLGEGTGSMTMHFNTSVFREMAKQYNQRSRDGFFDLLVVNDDADSNVGAQKILLKQVNFDEVTLSVLDAEAEYIEETMPFTFNDWDLLEGFNGRALIQS